ncbi:MAG TPA: N-acetylmuramoyl-L-alanine amidase [Chitinolyticbacter sp.]|nr:N-acetylmuramoyl-L-alanine amidase [Chitinolyticbacter sp.]
MPGKTTNSRRDRAVGALAGLLLVGSATAATIAIDVGHSLSAPGATSSYGETEFSYNRALALEIARTLRGAGHLVLLIGGDGDATSLRDRPAMAAAGRAEFFLSVHHDSAQPQFLRTWHYQGAERYEGDHSGYSFYVFPQHPRLTESARCAGAMSQALAAQGFVRTLHHAEGVAGEHRPLRDAALGVYDADFAVLRGATMPAVLFEAGVIVNKRDALTLAQPATRLRIAAAVRDGLAACLPR